MRGPDELLHGDWDKDQQRYEDGCREDRPHPSPGVDQGVDQPDDDNVKREYRRNLRRARANAAGLEEILRTWDD